LLLLLINKSNVSSVYQCLLLTFCGSLTHAVVRKLSSVCKQPTTCRTSHKFLLCMASNVVCKFAHWAAYRLATCKQRKFILQYRYLSLSCLSIDLNLGDYILFHKFWGYVAVCVQLYCRCFTVLHLVITVFHYTFRPTWPSSSVYSQ
jgi:hypothetical protein